MRFLIRGCIVFIGVVAIAIFIYIVFFWGEDFGEVSSIGKGGLAVCFICILGCLYALWSLGSWYLKDEVEEARKKPYYEHYIKDYEEEHGSGGRFDSQTGRRRR